MIVADTAAFDAWSNVTPIAIFARATGLVRVRIPPTVAPDAAGAYDDVRIVDDLGTQIPYALDPAEGAAAPRDVPLIDTGFVRGAGSRGVVDLGAGGTLEDSLTLLADTDALPTYFERVSLDASDDRIVWRNVVRGALIYRVAEDGGAGNQTIAFPHTRSRWLRVRIEDAHAPFPLTGATVARNASAPPSFVELPVSAVPDAAAIRAAAPAAHVQVWRFDAPIAMRPGAVSFAIPRGTFSRPVTISTSEDGTTWSADGSDTIARYADGSTHLSFAFSERTARHVRVTIDDGDDAPLAGVRPRLLALPHFVVFAVADGRSYRMLSGNALAQPPSYDLADRLAHENWGAGGASTGATSANPHFVDDRPLLARYPWLLTVAVVAIAAVLAGLAIRTIRTAEQTA